MKQPAQRRPSWPLLVSCLLLVIATVLSACQPIQPPTADSNAGAAIPEVTITVSETEFTIPDNFPGGIVRVTVKNTSNKDLDVGFARVRTGGSVAKIKELNQDFMNNLVPLMQVVSFMPGFNPLAAGQSEQMIIDFKTGQFLLDATEHTDGPPIAEATHIYAEFTADKLVGTVEPQPDVKVEMTDFAYIMPDEVKAGKQLWEYHNTGKQWHMQFFVKPVAGATMDDVMTALMAEGEPAGPPPFEIMPSGGIAPIGEGERVWVEVDLAPGEYMVACPIPDVMAMMKGEAPKLHMALGMHRLLTVTDNAATTPADAIPQVTITAQDFAFAMPDALPAGLVSLTLKNEGKANHHALVAHLKEGATLDQVQAVLQDPQGDASTISDLSFFMPDTDPGASNQATVNLQPGNWVIVSFSVSDMSGQDPTPDWAKGSLKPFTVTGEAAAAVPAANLVLTIGNDTFDMPSELAAGPQTIQVVNHSDKKDAYAFFVKLGDNTTVADILAMFDAFFSGQQPEKMVEFHPVGGLMGHDVSQSYYTTIDFTPGNYAVMTSINANEFPYSGLSKTFTVK